MSDAKPSIDLLVPGLLGPIPSLRELDTQPSAPVLEKYLARAYFTQVQAQDYEASLFDLFGLEGNSQNDHPTAPFTLLSDGGKPGNDYWIQASPVHLRPDGDGILLFDSGVMDIEQEEALELAELFNDHFSDRPWELVAPTPKRWYLRLEQEPTLYTSPLHEVSGRNVDSFLPQGEDASEWRSIMNEVQMLFHMAKVNLLRDGRGQFPINGIWLHGGGRLQSIESSPFDFVTGEEPLIRGMGITTDAETLPLPANSLDLLDVQGSAVVVNDILHRPTINADPLSWLEALESFESWLEPVLAGVRFKRLDYLKIHPCDGTCYRLDASAMRRFWRFKRSISSYLSL